MFTKFDTDKARFDLLVPEFLLGVARVLTIGAKKYSPDNWKKCTEPERYYAAAQRHMNAFHSGEYDDGESGLSHLFHATCCIMFLWGITNALRNDNREAVQCDTAYRDKQ
jgi:hypothetical protein